MRKRIGWIALGVALVLGAGMPTAMAAELPLPRGMSKLPEPTQVQLGTGTLNVHSFVSELDVASLIRFYQRALPRAGWRVTQLPWQAQHTAVTDSLKSAVSYQRQSPQAGELRQMLAGYEQTSKTMRRQIFASHGREHVIVNLWPMEESGTMVFLNRWQGGRFWTVPDEPLWQDAEDGGDGSGDRQLKAVESQRADEGATPWSLERRLAVNACCAGTEVPQLAGSLPFAVPRYPGAKAVAQGTRAGRDGTTVLLTTSDAAEEVAAYYRRQMPLNGWKLVRESQEAAPASGAVQQLTYRKPDRVCELTVAGASKTSTEVEAPRTVVTVAVTSGAVQEGRRQ